MKEVEGEFYFKRVLHGVTVFVCLRPVRVGEVGGRSVRICMGYR